MRVCNHFLRQVLLGLGSRPPIPLYRVSRFATSTASTSEGTTLSRQNELKRYPVPLLQETLAKYVKTVPQFLDKREFEATKQAVKELAEPGGVGQKLQNMLEKKASASDNWVRL